MAVVALLRREEAVRFPVPQQPELVAAVTYSTSAVPPRIIHLPRSLYREATPEERAANPRYVLLPVGAEAEEEERRAIAQDMERVFRPAPTTFEL